MRATVDVIMPLIVMCGIPSSGKTTRTNEIKKHLELMKKIVVVVGDHVMNLDKNSVYADSKKEVGVRGDLRSAVLREISKDSVVILDSLNYIKGFRYELFCGIKSAQTPHCVVHCDVSQEDASKWNSLRPENERYSQDVFDALVMRFEPPIGKNRWDKPLFSLKKDDELNGDEIHSALFEKRPPARNMSTVSQPLSSTNFLYELDKITQEIVTTIIKAQKTSLPGEEITVPGAKDKISLTRHLSPGELQRHRRQFISYTKLHPVDDVTTIPNMFVQYLGNSIK
ncbi:Protein KTI12-like [Holothuria leucospilota]|uniref:Protein KTI12 homolog n=1 Tax=Holothuria leucospilota TaxID=206669 RepID=A0A9Q1H7S0_HOLLE|nr:Protein KTI12-like [Holothuria leucospilota]